MLTDIELRPNKQNWAPMIKHVLSRLGFLEVWNAQGVGNMCIFFFFFFFFFFKTRVRDIEYIQDWHSRLENSTRARVYIKLANFHFQRYLELLKIEKVYVNKEFLRIG